MVIEGGPRLIRSWMKQVDILKTEYDVDVIWVTSGAIATARHQIKKETGQTLNSSRDALTALAEKQALSALGQPIVMHLYNRALAAEKLFGSQVLLTADDLANRDRRKNLVRTLSTLVKWGVLPILNENDAVSTTEIQFGDNDQLSALVATHMKADRLLLLTDVDGLYDSDPKKNTQARHVSELAKVPF
jgi:glutamate 5-kinase